MTIEKSEGVMSGIEELEDFVKSKYIKRTGTPPNYRYEYAHEKVEKEHSPGNVSELALYIENDGDLYRQMHTPQMKNLANKMASGKYDHDAATKMFTYLADAGAKKYVKEHGGSFSTADRAKVARKLADDFLAEAKEGEHDHRLNKKNQKAVGSLKEGGKKDKAEKSMDIEDWLQAHTDNPIDDLIEKAYNGEEVDFDEFLEKAGGAGGLPTGAPKIGGVGNEQGGPLAAVGKTSGSGDSTSLGTGPTPANSKEKLSEDDEEDEKNMKPHKKPIEKVKKSMKEENHYENARLAAKLRKGEEDVTAGVGIAPPKQEEKVEATPETIWRQRNPDSMVFYSTASDDEIVKLTKGESGYENGAPTVTPASLLIHQQRQCTACLNTMAKSLAVCPHCGDGAQQHQIAPNVILEGITETDSRIGPALRPKVEEDLYLPNGVISDDE